MFLARHKRQKQLSRVIGILFAVVGITRAVDASDWRDSITFTLSERVRGEFVDWFRPPSGTAPANAHRYNFFASQLRVGARVTFPHIQFVLEMQDTRILNLPRKASLAPPVGNLGPGAIYFSHTRDADQGESFLKQGYLTFRRSGLSASVGRFEYSDGLETHSCRPDPRLAQA